MKLTLLLTILFFSISVSWARPLDIVRHCFNDSFKNANVYVAGWCNRNTKNLYLQCFYQNNLDGYVLYLMTIKNPQNISADIPARSVSPLLARTGVTDWQFHVLLESQGYIYDLDYTINPQIPTVSEYFHKMFGVSSQNGQKMVVRVIPAQEYAEAYDDIGQNWDYYINNPEGFYPLEDVLSYLKNFKRSETSTALSHLTR